MIGQTISHYKILEKLGEGGMGVVYKAEDTNLGRIVALKLLPSHLKGTEEEKARFRHEAKSAATLNHPNICTIHAMEEFEGRQFIDMEYVDGETLSKILPIGKAGDVISYAAQIGEALHEAHGRGIVHRDIKADNIMVNSKNQVKVMDFGLAKLKGSLKLTKTSSTVGTLAYMAPEQIQGGDVDARSDIFSFGVLLFEMLTGKLPFRGEHEAAMMYSILNEEPESVLKYRQDVSPEVDHVLRRAMEKDPADRYQHADDMVSELRRSQKQSARVSRPDGATQTAMHTPPRPRSRRTIWMAATGVVLVSAVAAFLMFRGAPDSRPGTPAGRKMLVVMPFENLGSQDQEYFADGITDEITSRLSGISGLGVIARSSAMQYKKTTKSIRQIGEELGVNYVLQGTIRWENENGMSRVRVTPQLINVADGTQIWSQPSEAVVASAFQIQADIASHVAGALDITLLGNEKKSLEAKLTNNADAYDAYLRGNEYSIRSTGERDYRIAEQMFEKAVRLDPDFLAAHARLAALHSHIYWEQYDHTEERARKSKEEAETALRLGPNDPEAHGAMGWYYYHCLRDYDRALVEFNSALEQQPNNTDLLLGVAAIYRRIGRWDDALPYFRKIVEIDPRSPGGAGDLAVTYSYMRQYRESEEYYDRSISLAPDIPQNYTDKALIRLLWKGDLASAQHILDIAIRQKVGMDDPGFVYYTLYVRTVGGRYREAVDFLESSGYDILDYQYWRYPKTLLLGQLYNLLHNPEKSRAMYGTARDTLEREIRQKPDDSRLHGALGIALAGLGRKEEAIREGKRGVELMPWSVDAGVGPERIRELAQIYTMVGDDNGAIEELRKLLSGASLISAALLKLDPTWAPLSGNAGYQKLLKEYP